MSHLVSALFENSYQAGEAVMELKRLGFEHNISLLSKDDKDASYFGPTLTEEIMGSGRIRVGGPIMPLFFHQTQTKRLFEFLLETGLPRVMAEEFERSIGRGGIMLSVSVDHNDEKRIVDIFDKYSRGSKDIRHKAMETVETQRFFLICLFCGKKHRSE